MSEYDGLDKADLIEMVEFWRTQQHWWGQHAIELEETLEAMRDELAAMNRTAGVWEQTANDWSNATARYKQEIDRLRRRQPLSRLRDLLTQP